MHKILYNAEPLLLLAFAHSLFSHHTPFLARLFGKKMFQKLLIPCPVVPREPLLPTWCLQLRAPTFPPVGARVCSSPRLWTPQHPYRPHGVSSTPLIITCIPMFVVAPDGSCSARGAYVVLPWAPRSPPSVLHHRLGASPIPSVTNLTPSPLLVLGCSC